MTPEETKRQVQNAGLHIRQPGSFKEAKQGFVAQWVRLHVGGAILCQGP